MTKSLIYPELRRLVEALIKARAEAEKLGLFLYDREPLTCPKCGLREDVTFEGYLLVTRPGARERDTGLRFEANEKTLRARCPACKTRFGWEEPDFEDLAGTPGKAVSAARRPAKRVGKRRAGRNHVI